MGDLLAGVFAHAMAKFEMTKRKRKRAIDPIIAYAGIGNLGPADRR